MSSFTPMLIAPFASGLVKDMEPWLAPPDSFRSAKNVHIHHGYVQKRAGYILFGTLSNGTRVMGIQRYINSDGSKSTLGFDTTRAYLYNAVTMVFDLLDSAAIFDSGEYDYIWGVNWQSANVVNRLYFTNGLAYDGASLNGIRYFPGAVAGTTDLLTPSTGGGNTLYGSKLIFTLGQRIIALHTFENDGGGTSTFPQRARWCAKQDPANWNDVTAGGGDFSDAATGDQIVSAQAIQNQIIVFFTNSVWSLVPTGDPSKAFRWVRLNDFRACDGKMASVAYDRTAIALGIRGITASDGSQTTRIDSRIQNFTTDEINVEEFKKVFCLRSYVNTRWWSLYPAIESTENDAALIYDDDSKGFTTYDISLNCLGYGNAQLNYGLDDFTVANNLDFSLNDMGDDTLTSWYWDESEDILLGGDISGNVFQLDIGTTDNGSDINCEIVSASWNPFQQQGIESQFSFVDLYIDTDKITNGSVQFFKNDEVSPYREQPFQLLPNLNYLSSISSIAQDNPCTITAPNHGLSTGDGVFIYGVLGMIEVNSGNEYAITVVDANSFTLDGIDATGFTAYVGSGQLYDREFYQTKTWIRAYGGGKGYLHHIKLTFEGGDRPFRIHSFKPSFKPSGKRTIS